MTFQPETAPQGFTPTANKSKRDRTASNPENESQGTQAGLTSIREATLATVSEGVKVLQSLSQQRDRNKEEFKAAFLHLTDSGIFFDEVMSELNEALTQRGTTDLNFDFFGCFSLGDQKLPGVSPIAQLKGGT